MRIKFITLTCEKYHNTRVSKIRETWGSHQDISFLSDMNVGDDIIGYDYLPKGYENIHYKYSEFFRNYSNMSYDWYFFTDDDTYVNIGNVEKLLEEYNPSDPICIGICGELNPDATDKDGNYTGFPLHTIRGSGVELPLKYVGGGAGFILSVKSMKVINRYLSELDTDDIPRCYNSDVTIGFWMRGSMINLINTTGFWWTTPNNLGHNDDDIKNSYTYHYVNEKMMNELYEKLHNNTSKGSIK